MKRFINLLILTILLILLIPYGLLALIIFLTIIFPLEAIYCCYQEYIKHNTNYKYYPTVPYLNLVSYIPKKIWKVFKLNEY